jgi:hypothetical protein
MEQPIWLVIAIIVAVISFVIILMILGIVKVSGLESLKDIFNISKFLDTLKNIFK